MEYLLVFFNILVFYFQWTFYFGCTAIVVVAIENFSHYWYNQSNQGQKDNPPSQPSFLELEAPSMPNKPTS